MRIATLFTALCLCISTAAFSQQKAASPAPAAKAPAAQAAPAAKPPAAAAPQAVRPAAPAPRPAAPAAVKAPPKPDPQAEAAQKAQIEAGQKAIKELAMAQAKRKQAEDVIHEWFRRWSAMDGKEETINEFMALYAPDATHEMGPNERQGGGAVSYEGEKLIRKMAENYSQTWTSMAYRPTMRTINEKTQELIQTAEAPWGATQVAVEFTAGQASAETKKRFMLRGAAFFEIQPDGKLSYVRMYMPKDEVLEITGPTSVGCGN